MDAKSILRMARTRQRFEKYMTAAFKEKGFEDMAPAHGALATALKYRGSLTMSELALWVEKRKPTVTVLISKMQKHKLVKCIKDKDDQRITRVSLTEKGEHFAQEYNALTSRLIDVAITGIPKRKQEIFTEVLGKVLDNLQEYK